LQSFFSCQNWSVFRNSQEGIEYYSNFAFSSLIGYYDTAYAIKCTEEADRYGLSTSTTGALLAFAAELYQRGIVTRRDTDGLELTWGNQFAFLELIRKIALRDGVGGVLSDGQEIAAERIGKGAERYTMSVLNVAAGGDRRVRYGYALSQAVSSRGQTT
jgi:aldehyde:ferredoxin oxidoreductase